MKKEILIPLLLLFFGILFIIISIIVFFTKGNSWFIGKKLKVGALILSLTGFISCGSPPKPTCYELPPSKEYIDSMANVRKQDSIKDIEKQKQLNDSIAEVKQKNKGKPRGDTICYIRPNFKK